MRGMSLLQLTLFRAELLKCSFRTQVNTTKIKKKRKKEGKNDIKQRT